jgi:hypothetical protein
MPLFNRAVTAGSLALLGAYFLWWRLSEYDREPKPVRVRAPGGPGPALTRRRR